MLHLLDESLEAFLRAAVPLPVREIDVAFDTPDKEWAARVSKPTVNLYLWDVRRNVSTGYFNGGSAGDENGRAPRRTPMFRVDCRYLVTAWTSDVRDEHSLLGAALMAFLRHTELEREYLQGAYRDVTRLPFIEIGADDGQDNSSFWTALGGQLKPGLDVTVTATVDAALLASSGPPPERMTVPSRGSDAPSG
jgi:hypothetical protein